MRDILIKYIIVTDKPDLAGSLKGDNNSRMKFFNSKQDAIQWICDVGVKESDPRKVRSIFTVNEHGEVVFLEVVFDGKLDLKPIQKEKQNEL